jgi:polar amino acid transport system substrate-binding protein
MSAGMIGAGNATFGSSLGRQHGETCNKARDPGLHFLSALDLVAWLRKLMGHVSLNPRGERADPPRLPEETRARRRITALANEKSQKVQDAFPDHVRKNTTPVAMIPVKGVKYQSKNRIRTLLRPSVALLALTFSAGVAAGARAESTLQTVEKRGEFHAGITTDSPPSAYLDAQGRQVGYCADVARYLAKRLGVKLVFVPVTAVSRIPLLTTGRIDAEVAVTTPQKVRNEVVDFTYSYIWDNAVLLVRDGESTNPADYQNNDKTIGATQGDGFIDRWKQISPNTKFQLFHEATDVAGALRKGDVDAAIVNQNAAIIFAKTGGLKMSPPWTNSPDAIMVRQDDSKWRNWLNWALQRMWVEGTLQKLYVKWYGVAPTQSLGDYGEIQPRVGEIGKTDDPWNALPANFLQTLLGPDSWRLD